MKISIYREVRLLECGDVIDIKQRRFHVEQIEHVPPYSSRKYDITLIDEADRRLYVLQYFASDLIKITTHF